MLKKLKKSNSTYSVNIYYKINMQDYFVMHNDKGTIKKGTLVKFIAITNEACLIEDVDTKEREWIMRYDIYPLENHDMSGPWLYSKYYQNKIPKEYFDIIKKLRKNSNQS